MKKQWFAGFFILFLFFVLYSGCSEEDGGNEVKKTINISNLGFVAENIDYSFWADPASATRHAYYNFFVYINSDVTASDIQSARVYAPDNSYWILNPSSMFDAERSMIGGWFRFYINLRPNSLYLGEFTTEIILNNGNSDTFTRTITAPGKLTTNGFLYVFTEDSSPFDYATPILKRADDLSGTKNETTITIQFTTDDENVYNGYIWLYDADNNYIARSSTLFKDTQTGNYTSIISDLYTDGITPNIITLQDSDILYQSGASYNQIDKFIVVFVDGWQFANQGLFNNYNYRSISAKTSLTSK